MASISAGAARRSKRWTVFVCVAIAQFMVVLDTAIINVALPVIKRQLHFSNSGIQWVVTAYVLTFGGFLLLGGRAADLFGRRRTLLTGMVAFTVCSLLVGLSPSAALVVAFRALQGMGAAVMAPSALSIVLATFDEGRERNQALGYWSMVATGGAASGLLLGGVLTQYAGWRWNFFINVPVGVVMSFLIARTVPAQARQKARTGLDLPGALLSTVGLMAAVLYFSEAPSWGWLSGSAIGSLALSIVLLGAFTMTERRAEHPLLDLSIFKSRNLSGSNIMMAAVYGGNLGMFFLMTLYLQDVEHYSAIRAGFAFLPFPVLLGTVSSQLRRFVARHGYRRYLILGPALAATGMAWLCFLPVHGTYAVQVLPAFVLMPVGYGMSFAPMYAAATSGVTPAQSGLASGLIATAQQMGGAVGLAILSAIAAAFTSSLARDPVARALTSGYRLAMLVAVGLTFLAVVIAVAVIQAPNPPSTRAESSQGPARATTPTGGRER